MATRQNPNDNAAIARKLRTDSQALADAEWWTRKRIYGLSDETVRRLISEYEQAYKEISAALMATYDEAGGSVLAQRVRLLNQIEARVNELYAQLGEDLGQSTVDAFKQGYYGRAYALDMLTVQDWAANVHALLPTEGIRAMLLQDYIGTDDWLDLERADMVGRLKKSLTQSMIQGEGIQKAAGRLRRELGLQSGQTKQFKGGAWRTVLIARTEIMRASNLGALAIYEQNQDVLSGWEWLTAKDERVCPVCGPLDGTVYKFGSQQLLPPSGSHPGCRCTVIPVLQNQALQDELTGGPRETYMQWAARRGLFDDGGLATQRAADAKGINR